MENMLSPLSVYDMLIDCPKNFTVNFTIRRNFVKFVDIFILVLNDTSTSHRLVLSSVQGPQLFTSFDNLTDKNMVEEESPWVPVIVILVVCGCASLLLVMIYMYCAQRKPKMLPTDIRVPKPNLGPEITLLKNIDKGADERMAVQTKCIMIVLIILYVAYAVVFTFTTLFVLFQILQSSSLNSVIMATNVSSQIQWQMQQSLNRIVDSENTQLNKMFHSAAGRVQACSNHMKTTLNQSTPDVNAKLLSVLTEMFENSGTVQQTLGDYFAKQRKLYQKDIDKFLADFNKTLDKNLHKVQVTYASYLKSVAENNWLEFPLQIFKKQQMLQGRHTGKVSDYLADFLTWLEIDKVQEIFEIKEIVMDRYCNISLDFV